MSALILDSRGHPEAWCLSTEFEADGRLRYTVETGDSSIDDETLLGVWWRRPKSAEIAPAVEGRATREFCTREARTHLQGWLQALGQRVMNPIGAQAAADNKVFQLAAAREVGLTIPRTLVTNAPDRATRFIRSCPDGAVYKILTTSPSTILETRLLGEDHISHLETLRHAPVIFQECVPKRFEVRVTIVDGQVFPVTVHCTLPDGHVDWRLDAATEFRPHALPARIETGILDLMRQLGLRYGALDLCVTPDGDYYFLEVNTAGQFLFAEIHAGQPITSALAGALCAPQDPRH